jgi:diguanylate cyclase (GGDEF)-like protein
MWDIDHFKNVNDEHGHLMGDMVLKEITALFRKSFRTGVDLIGRYGGEEFVMLLPDTTREGALILAERLRLKVEAQDFGGGKVKTSISGGIATFPEDGATYNRLIEQADIYLYKAKRTGRNKVCTLEAPEDHFIAM